MMNRAATCCILLAFLSLSGCLHSMRLPDAADSQAVIRETVRYILR
jgi:hypothetical protein